MRVQMHMYDVASATHLRCASFVYAQMAMLLKRHVSLGKEE